MNSIESLHDRVDRLEQRVRRSQRLAAGLGLLAGVAGLMAFRSVQERSRFSEIDVERINVIQPDGKLAMVIANRPRLPSPMIDGEEVDTGNENRGPGMLFYNSKGDEAGGLIYGSNQREDGYSAYALLAFDQYNQDQVVFLSYSDDGESQRSGLYVVDRPTDVTMAEMKEVQEALNRASGEEKAALERRIQERVERGEFGSQRVFVGSDSRTAMVRLKDTEGRDRIRLFVDSANVARLDFLDADGVVVYRIPEAEKLP